MKKIVIIPNSYKDNNFAVTDKVADKLISMGMAVYMHGDFGYKKSKLHIYDNFPEQIDLIIVIGGDGSVIDASGVAIERGIPLLGVNLGKVGYLAEVEVAGLELLERLASGDYSITEKMLLDVKLDNAELPCERYAVNDVAISRDSLEHMADIGVEDSIGNAIKFRADGVILATPQGSTAYSFSSGGPVIAHDVESVLLTPVSPHSFFNRSVIFNSSDVIRVTNAGDLPLNVFVDGRCVGALSAGKSCRVKKAEKSFRILTFTRNSMFSSLFKKMRILGDID